ncbi:transcriptional regulator, LysR family [Streptomyces lincolnensis]|uniref:Transcriptional regulator, LysR family n=1 Tax=Streptomyces lincolnensis TaxID=1915 RepID=A0A1B1MPK3_STRLN|nr:LysR family transcriptional regulator [Streptomyces lincolnensis]ANS70535.1 transcriptional regulator, LysR family [Streptomyces lincolnensis]
MDTPQLEAFLAVVDVGSFTRAAARLGVSQPAVTNRVRGLEQSLGTELLRRLPHGVTPTPAGDELVPYARDIVALTTRALRVVASRDRPCGTVRVGTLGSLTGHRLLPLIEYVYLRYPDVEISMCSPTDGDALSHVRDGRFDCAFFVDCVRRHKDLETRLLCPEPLVLVAGPDHPLTASDHVCAEDLRGATLVRSDQYAAYHRRFEQAIGVSRPAELRLFALDSFDAVKRSVANGIGVALVPEVAVEKDLLSGDLRRVAWTPPFETCTQVAWRRNNPRNPALDVLVQAAARVVEEQLSDRLQATG